MNRGKRFAKVITVENELKDLQRGANISEEWEIIFHELEEDVHENYYSSYLVGKIVF